MITVELKNGKEYYKLIEMKNWKLDDSFLFFLWDDNEELILAKSEILHIRKK